MTIPSAPSDKALISPLPSENPPPAITGIFTVSMAQGSMTGCPSVSFPTIILETTPNFSAGIAFFDTLMYQGKAVLIQFGH
ncbi:hypothetical protein EI200_07215 [Peribacillus simplex]|uniref:hypothetical protein n=1 Tax=Peribacillus simplex TaxID=1478 RepID=UPI000F633BB0|nr:hypothetical protein [Peribacillus simplex]RRN72942.1 hypothetical protein EI200_07215 [Peribacillus simplex]